MQGGMNFVKRQLLPSQTLQPLRGSQRLKHRKESVAATNLIDTFMEAAGLSSFVQGQLLISRRVLSAFVSCPHAAIVQALIFALIPTHVSAVRHTSGALKRRVI